MAKYNHESQLSLITYIYAFTVSVAELVRLWIILSQLSSNYDVLFKIQKKDGWHQTKLSLQIEAVRGGSAY